MGELYFEIIIKDESYRKVAQWKFTKRQAGDFLRIINDNFGLGLTIKNNKPDRDLDWLK